MTLDALVVADDLTGATDTGAAFARRGYDTSVRRADSDVPAWPDDVDVGVVDTDSRYLPADAAAERVARAVEATDARAVYKKVDSTLRGNLVAEIDAAIAATDAAVAVVAPAFPATGRVTAGGYHLVDGVPVAETAAGADPDAPVETSSLPERLTGSEHSVEHVGLETVRDSDALAERVRAFAASEGTPLVCCDATTTAHLDAVGAALASVETSALAVGSGGLAAHLRLGESTSVLGVVGSVAPETLAQLDALPGERVVALDPKRAVTDPRRAAEEAAAALAERLADAEWAVATAAREREAVDRALAAGHEAGLDDATTKARVAETLAETAAAVRETRDLDGLFATGGAVAGATLSALDGEGVRLTGQEVESGVPVGRVDGGPVDGLPVVTKAGAFGAETAISKSLAALARYDE